MLARNDTADSTVASALAIDRIQQMLAAALVRIDPGLLVKSDPPIAMTRPGDPEQRCAKEAPVFDLPSLVSA